MADTTEPVTERIPGHTVTLAIDTSREVFARITCQAPADSPCRDSDGDCQAADWIVDDSVDVYGGLPAEVQSGVPAVVWEQYDSWQGAMTWRWAYVSPRPVPAEQEPEASRG